MLTKPVPTTFPVPEGLPEKLFLNQEVYTSANPFSMPIEVEELVLC